MAKIPKRISFDLLDDDLKARVGGDSGESTQIEWTSILNKPIEFPPSVHTHNDLHTHVNKTLLDAIKQSDIDKWNTDVLVPHNHDGVYITPTQLNTSLEGKADVEHTHTDISPAQHTHLEADIKNLDKYTKAEVDAKLLLKSDTTHTHDGRYNTKSEVSNLLSNKADKVHSHTKANISDFAHTHNYSEINNPPTIPTDTSQLAKSDVYTKGEVDNMMVESGAGDMTKAVYDSNNDGKVNSAEIADSVPWNGILEKPETFPPDVHSHYELHSHSNMSVLNLIEEQFTKVQKDKLDSLNNYSHPVGDGNLHVPANGTTNAGKVLKATNVAGNIGWGTLNYADVGASPTSHMHTIAQILNFPTFSRLTLGTIQPTDGYWLKVVE